jgi:arylsulfatase A-like enzyme
MSGLRKAVLLMALVSMQVYGAGASSPNIVFIFADDWGYGDLSSHGSTWIKTPNIDRMASEGIDFESFTVNSPVCSPSRTAVMTGQFPARNSIHQHFAAIDANQKRAMPDWLDPAVPMLPRLLQNAGYKTGHFGKWHLGKGGDAPAEDAYGYDEYATFNGSANNEIKSDGLASVDHAVDFIKRHKDQPFFVNLWLHETHLPHYPIDKYLEQFKDLDEQKKVYASVVAEGDEGVGRVLKLLKELDIDQNTLVIFSSDNGPELTRPKSAWYHNNKKKDRNNDMTGLGGYFSVGETAGLKGQKRSLYAGGIRVPFIVRWPGVVPEGKTDATSVMTAVDLLPTFLEVAGVELPEGFKPDGQSVLSAFKAEDFERTKPIFWEWKGPKVQDFTWPHLGIRDGRWKLITNAELQRTELYDLEGDWAEAKDVSAEHPDVVKALSAKLHAWKETLPVGPKQSTLSKKRK